MIALLVLSCQDKISITETTETKTIDQTTLSIDSIQLEFSRALSMAVAENLQLRELIKREASKRFNNDDEVLYQLIKNQDLGGRTVSEVLSGYSDSPEVFSKELDLVPLLTILVPTLPDFSISTWSTDHEIPFVAVRLIEGDYIPIFDNSGDMDKLSLDLIPGGPVIVVKQNERVVVNSNGLKNTNTSLSTANFSYSFIDPAFNGIEEKLKTSRHPTSFTSTDTVNASAYNIGVDWHRDYVYYGLTPDKVRGEFRPRFEEHITSFKLLGDNWYKYIVDQSGDPTIVNNSRWTDGAFEFKIAILCNPKNGVTPTIYKIFSASGEDIMEPTLTVDSRTGIHKIYRLENARGKAYNPNIPIVAWDLENYGTAWKITISEIDNDETQTYTEEVSTTYVSNFEISNKITEKVGLKYGGKSTTSSKRTLTVVQNLKSDDLGETIINFFDPIVINVEVEEGRRGDIHYYTKREINTAMVSLCIEPKTVY